MSVPAGLSYTTFTLTWTQSPKPLVLDTGLDEDTVTMTATVTNTGDMAGDEVVLAFIKPNNVTMGRCVFARDAVSVLATPAVC